MRRSLVCGALWYVALYGGHLTGPDHYVAKLQISFFSGSGGTAVSLASGSRFVTPTLDRTRPRSRHIQYTHARYGFTGAYTRYYKKWRAQRESLSIEHCVGTDSTLCTPPRLFVLGLVGPHVRRTVARRVTVTSESAGGRLSPVPTPPPPRPPPCVVKLNLEASNCHPKYMHVSMQVPSAPSCPRGLKS